MSQVGFRNGWRDGKINYAGCVALSTCDWFGHGAYVIFLNGCPMFCPNCHNAQLRTAENMVALDEIKAGILGVSGFVDHVVISGGEPAAQPEVCKAIIDFCHSVENLVAIETSGCYPIVNGFDMIMLGVKTSLERDLYDSYTGFSGSFGSLMSNLAKMDPKRSEIRLVLFPESKYDIKSLGVLQGFPIRILIGRGSGHGVVDQGWLREFGFELYEFLDYSNATIEKGRMLICP